MKGHKAPAYSVGRARRTLSLVEEGPGPGKYFSDLRQGSPRAVIGTAERKWGQGNEEAPGPATYNPITVRKKGPAALILSRKPIKEVHKDLPGPADYSPLHSGQTFSYSFRGKWGDKQDTLPPGPGTYQAEKPTRSSPKAVFGRSKRTTVNVHESPGPIYSPKTSITVKGGSFGKSHRQGIPLGEAPGPGSYVISRELLSLGSVITPRRPLTTDRARLGPGPADYIVSQSYDEFSQRGYSIGRSTRFTEPKEGVPAATGLGKEITKKKNPEFSIGKSKRSSVEMNTTVPGPGTYMTTERGYSPRYTMRKRPSSGVRLIPGPGDYSPKAVLKSSPRAVIGGAPRIGVSVSTAPPPGAYDMPVMESGPRFTFTRSRRTLSATDTEVPGPGEYNHVDTIGQV